MIKVSVMYPAPLGAGADHARLDHARFDHEYYRDRHLPMLQARMGAALHHYTIDRGLDGGRPGTPPTYVAMCHLYCESAAAFQAAFAPHLKEIMADVANYTDLTPVMQVSEVVVG